MPSHTNPVIVWLRIQADMWRLSKWAERIGNVEYKSAIDAHIQAFNELGKQLDFSAGLPTVQATKTRIVGVHEGEHLDADTTNAIKRHARQAFQRGQPLESNPETNVLRAHIWATEWGIAASEE